MTLPRCLSEFYGTTCELPAGHPGDHLNTRIHANAVHEIVWTDDIDELRHRWRRK